MTFNRKGALLALSLTLVTGGCLGGLLPPAPQPTPVPVAPASTTPPAPVAGPVTTGNVTVNPVQQVEQNVTVIVPTPVPTLVPTVAATPVPLPPSPSPQPIPFYITVTLDGTHDSWLDTGKSVAAGQVVVFNTSGEIAPYVCCWSFRATPTGKDPSGKPADGYKDPMSANENGFAAPAPGLTTFAAVGKIGDGKPFYIGRSTQVTASTTGRLYVAFNDNKWSDNGGSFHFEIEGK